MKNYFTVILGVIGFQLGYAQCPNIVWSDEFSGTELDITKWNYQTGTGCAEGICGWGNNELQHYKEENVTVSNGTLKITAKKERVQSSGYTSGRINSKNKGDFTYGRFEASIKLPYGDGLWPAFWMLSTNEPYGGWPQSGEIDIMEFVASNPEEIFGTIHYGDPYPNNQYQGNDYVLENGAFPDAFHEFAIEWEPGEIRWFLDGILYSVKTTADVAPHSWPFDQDFHFLLNVAVGGNLGGTVNNGMLPATMEVDYVRVYDGFKAYLGGDRIVANQAQGVVYTVGNVPNNTNVTWSVPQGATIVNGQGSNTVTVDFGNTGGTVSASFDNGCETQQLDLHVTVEPPYIPEFSFENFDNPATATFASATGTLNEVPNPSANAVNGSALSGEYTRNSGEQYDVLVYNVSNINDASEYVNTSKKFYIDVYTSAPVGTDILLQLETSEATPNNYPTGRHSRYTATVAENNSWHRLEFSLLDQPDTGASDNAVGTMILLFASNSYTGDVYYFDNLDSYNADLGGGGNQSPSVSITSPSDGASYPENTSITITADASDADGSVTQVEFFADGVSIGTDASSPYTLDWSVPQGSPALTAVATDNEGATAGSQTVNVTGTVAGNATSVHVSSVTTGTAGAGQGNKYGTATVTIVDNLGSPVANASVNGTFSGTFNEQANGTTNASGVAVLQTQSTAKGGVTVNFCVDGVTATLPYDSASNVVSCSDAAKEAPDMLSGDENEVRNTKFTFWPNPGVDNIQINLDEMASRATVSIVDMNGRTVLSQEIQNNGDYVNINALAKGIYIVRIQDDLNRVKTVKLIK